MCRRIHLFMVLLGIHVNPVWLLWLAFPFCVIAQTVEAAPVKAGFGKPSIIATGKLVEFDSLPQDRRTLIEAAIAIARESPWLPYTVGGSEPSDGGFDCSGAMYFVMRKVDLDPPRTAAAQFQWLERSGRLRRVPAKISDLKHTALKRLQPGDLLFWGKLGKADLGEGDGEVITHVALYLGVEKEDKWPVMINSTDGRSYRGIKANGYGVYDFRLPVAGAKKSFIGYGTPPGIALIQEQKGRPSD